MSRSLTRFSCLLDFWVLLRLAYRLGLVDGFERTAVPLLFSLIRKRSPLFHNQVTSFAESQFGPLKLPLPLRAEFHVARDSAAVVHYLGLADQLLIFLDLGN